MPLHTSSWNIRSPGKEWSWARRALEHLHGLWRRKDYLLLIGLQAWWAHKYQRLAETPWQ